MRYAGSLSWQVRLTFPPGLMITGLFARDAAGLAVTMSFPPPPLDPSVSIVPRLRDLGTDLAAADWPVWWEAEIDEGAQPPHVRPHVSASRTLIGPDLQTLLDESAHPAAAWSTRHEAEHNRRVRDLHPTDRHATGDLVRSIGADLGRPVEPFELQVDVLPVQGRWNHRARRAHLQVSEGLYRDAPAYLDVLEPVIRSLA